MTPEKLKRVEEINRRIYWLKKELLYEGLLQEDIVDSHKKELIKLKWLSEIKPYIYKETILPYIEYILTR